MPLQVGHHWPASETQLKWCFAGVPIMAHRKKGCCQLQAKVCAQITG